MIEDNKKLDSTLEEIAAKLTDREHFPEMIARAKELLSNAKLIDPKNPNK